MTQQAYLLGQIKVFNSRFPPGSTVWWYETVPHGPVHELEVEKPAFLDPKTGTAMVFLKGVLNTVPIWNVFPVLEEKRNEVSPVPLDDTVAGKVAQANTLAGLAFDSMKKWCNVTLPGFGDRHHLKKAGLHFRAAAKACETAYRELGEG